MTFENKRVLVTGAGGFIGSHLAERLVKEGANTRAFVHYNALGSCGWLDISPIVNELEVISGDICDRDSILSAMKDIDIVFHLAALIGIPYSYHAPVSYVRTNIEGTLNTLQAARHEEVELIVHTSTSEVYGSAQFIPIDENHPLQGQSPYSATKIGADKIAEAFYLSHGVPVVTIRPFNTFGPRQSLRAVVPTIITQYMSDQSPKLGNLYPTRDLNFVENTVDGFILSPNRPEAVGKTINLGSGREISIGNLAQLIAQIMGKSIPVTYEKERSRPEKSEVDRLLADNTTARKLLGWKPKVSLEDGLTQTIEWIESNFDRYKKDGYVL